VSRYEDLVVEVTSRPLDDAPRLAFADHIATSEPERAKFIRDQIEMAKRRRAQRRTSSGDPHDPPKRFADSWTRLIAKYTRTWRFDRGFVAEVAIDPYLLLEYGEWLLLNFPIQVVELLRPQDGPFPLDELIDSPLLARFDALGINKAAGITAAELRRFVASPHLTRLRYLTIDGVAMKPDDYRALAQLPLGRQLLVLSADRDGYPGQSYNETDEQDMLGRYRMAWSEVPALGRELEATNGYLPWLHHENYADPFDGAWFVEHGILPVKPPGSR
jgi:uncharacterized protein (TIGR02996 family)